MYLSICKSPVLAMYLSTCKSPVLGRYLSICKSPVLAMYLSTWESLKRLYVADHTLYVAITLLYVNLCDGPMWSEHIRLFLWSWNISFKTVFLGPFFLYVDFCDRVLYVDWVWSELAMFLYVDFVWSTPRGMWSWHIRQSNQSMTS